MTIFSWNIQTKFGLNFCKRSLPLATCAHGVVTDPHLRKYPYYFLPIFGRTLCFTTQQKCNIIIIIHHGGMSSSGVVRGAFRLCRTCSAAGLASIRIK